MKIRGAARAARGMSSVIPVLLFAPAVARAQTDYFNTDRGRPLHVQDAVAIERYAFELQAAPLRWERSSGARVRWSIEPELAYGVLPRTQLEVGLPVYSTEGYGSGTRTGVGAVHVSVLHALNTETLGVPALALELSTAVPAGDFGPREWYTTLGALLTRTIGFGRLHLNVDATAGAEPADDEGDLRPGLHDLSRWTAGIAVDRAFPLRSLLAGVELVSSRALASGSDVAWRAAAGVRWQVNPYWAFDAGLGRTLDDERTWSLTIGAARNFGILRFFPVR